jgi:flagellar biosynthesis protein FliR
MTELLAQILDLSQASLTTGFVVFLRVGAAMSLLPAFGEHSIPARVRLVLGFAFTLVIAPAVAGEIAASVERVRLPYLLLTETVAGLALGLALRLFVLALQMAGSMAAQATSLAQVFGGIGPDPQPAIGHLMVIGGLALAVMAGLHVKIAGALIESYGVLPSGHLPGADLLSEWGIGRISAAFSLAFTLAAPFTIAAFIYNLALGVINRAMPQLMVSFVGAPALTAGGLMLMLLTLPLLLGIWSDGLSAFLADPFGGR